MEVTLRKSSLALGEASLESVVLKRRRLYKIGFRFTDHSGMQLIVDGKVIRSVESPAAKATLALADNSFSVASEISSPANRLQLFSEDVAV